GHMYTLANIIRYVNYTKQFEYLEYVEKGINALKSNIHKYLRANEQMYGLKTPVSKTGYDRLFTPYYQVHPLLLYYLYDYSNDSRLYEWYKIFLESSLFELNYSLETFPTVNNSELVFNINFKSTNSNILSNENRNSFKIYPLHDFLFREPISNFDKLGSLSIQVDITQIRNNFKFENSYKVTSTFPSVLHLDKIELYDSSFEIKISSNIYINTITFRLENGSIKDLTINNEVIYTRYKSYNNPPFLAYFVNLTLVITIVFFSYFLLKREKCFFRI
ncbi:MAG: D-glucuronyl C5-epimerase family protein, partial [Candidatus Heimdallarchaeaceae archaeon]